MKKPEKKLAIESMKSLSAFRDKWKPVYLTSSPSYRLFSKDCGKEEISYEENDRYILVGVFGEKVPAIDPNYQRTWSDGMPVKESEKRRIALRCADAYTDWTEGVCPIILW